MWWFNVLIFISRWRSSNKIQHFYHMCNVIFNLILFYFGIILCLVVCDHMLFSCCRRLRGAVCESLRPLSEMLMSCLHRPLTAYCRVVNTHLLHVLSRDYCLLDCFTAIRVCHVMFCCNAVFYHAVCSIPVWQHSNKHFTVCIQVNTSESLAVQCISG